MSKKLLIVGLALLTAACAPTPCDSSAAVAPGRTVTDDVSDPLAAHVDITKVSTTLADETLTAVFHLRDVPETLTFDRTGVEDNDLEYRWEVWIDVDGNRETGPGGFDYTLSASHFVLPSDSGRNTVASMTAFGKVQTNVWKRSSDERCGDRGCKPGGVNAGEDDNAFRGDSRHHSGITACIPNARSFGRFRRCGLSGFIDPFGRVLRPGRALQLVRSRWSGECGDTMPIHPYMKDLYSPDWG